MPMRAATYSVARGHGRPSGVHSSETDAPDFAGHVRFGPGAAGTVGYLAKMFPRISESFILNEVLALRRHGVPVRIYSVLPPTRDNRMHDEAADLLDEVYVLPAFGWRGTFGFVGALARCVWRRPRSTLRAVARTMLLGCSVIRFKRLFRAVHLADRLHRDRVVHFHAAWAHTPASVGGLACRINDIPWSMGAHAKDIHLANPESLRNYLQQARYTLTCTRTNVDVLERVGRRDDPTLPPPVIELYYHGVDCEYFDEPCPADRDTSATPVVLCVGRLVPKKGLDVLIDATALLVERGVDLRLEIIGEGPLRPELEKQIRRLGLERVVTLCGLKIRGEVREAYRRSACVVLASRIAADGDRDGIPNTLAEAMSSGVAVVATRLPGISELVVDGRTGLLVEPDNAAELAAAIARLVTDRNLRAKLGRAGRAHVKEMFDGVRWGRRVADRLARSMTIERVLYVSQDRGVPVRGSKGASVHVRSVVGSLRRDFGVASVVLTTNAGPEEGLAPRDTSIEEVRAEGRSVRWAEWLSRRFRDRDVVLRELLRLLDNRAIVRRGVEIARAWRADAVYERYSLTAFAGRRIARAVGVPHILEVNAPLAEEEERHRGLHFRLLARWAERRILRRADLVVVVSEALADHARRLGVEPHRILVQPNGVDPELFHPRRDGSGVRVGLRIEPGALLIGFCGQLKERYGLAGLIRAFAALPDETRRAAHLLLIGGGKQRKALTRLADELGMAERVHLTGAIDHEEIGAHLAACDILVAPYTGGGGEHGGTFYFSSMKVAEYTAVGKPVILSAPEEAAFRYRDQRNVVIVPPDDIASFSAAIQSLAGDPARRARMGRAAAAHPVRTWRDVVEPILEAIESCRHARWGWPGRE
jgi:glycosyltransferase involved in cell wall biosynthesis